MAKTHILDPSKILFLAMLVLGYTLLWILDKSSSYLVELRSAINCFSKWISPQVATCMTKPVFVDGGSKQECAIFLQTGQFLISWIFGKPLKIRVHYQRPWEIINVIGDQHFQCNITIVSADLHDKIDLPREHVELEKFDINLIWKYWSPKKDRSSPPHLQSFRGPQNFTSRAAGSASLITIIISTEQYLRVTMSLWIFSHPLLTAAWNEKPVDWSLGILR